LKVLIQTGLYGAGLYKVSSPQLIERYNHALEAMGVSATELDEFNIDMIGWSPEISEEKEDIFYLSHSLANPMAIILSIDQKDCPIYFPYHSFDKNMFDDLFKRRETQIMDITTQEALWLDIDNGISDYQHPKDLLFIDAFDISLETPDQLVNGAKQQKELVKDFLRESNAWEDEDIRNKVIQSGKDFGDLQKRQISMSSFRFSDIRTFYTEALGGVFVLRSSDFSNDDITIIAVEKERVKKGSGIDHVSDKKLFSQLVEKQYMHVSIDYLRRKPRFLERKKNAILGGVFTEQNSDVNFFDMTSAQTKGFLKKYRSEIPKIFFEIERLEKQLASNVDINVDDLSQELQYMLAIPNRKTIPKKFRRVFYRLMTYVDSHSIINLYRYNKPKFYNDYVGFSESKKHFVRDFILKYYLCAK